MAGDPSWDGLRIFVAVLRAGSFSAAADELGMAQSSVSEQIARLERQLEHRLFDRGPAGVRATERGAELAVRVAGPVDALTAATSRPADGAGQVRTVFVGGPAEFLSDIVLPGLFARLPREVLVAARFGLAEDLLDDLRSGAVDVLVSALPVRGADLAVTPLYDEEFRLVAHPDWHEGAVRDLDAVPVLAYGPDLPIIRRYWRSVFGRPPSRLTARVIAPDLRSLLRLVLGGAGMSVLPDYLIREHLASGALVELHEPEVAPLNTLYLVTRKPVGTPDPLLTVVREAVRDAAVRSQGSDVK